MSPEMIAALQVLADELLPGLTVSDAGGFRVRVHEPKADGSSDLLHVDPLHDFLTSLAEVASCLEQDDQPTDNAEPGRGGLAFVKAHLDTR